MTFFPEYVPENDGTGFAFEVVDLQLLRALKNLRIISARLTQPREIAFYVRHEYRHATRAKVFSERLERDRFSGASGPGDQAVAIRHLRQQVDRFLRLCDEDRFGHGQ